MAPQSRKRKSEAMDETRRPTTPTEVPASKRMKITAVQKQALIDNLQLEITERARHLRAHYALQCADLRARIERRVNRIPIAMRKLTMGELIAKHSAPQLQHTTASSIHAQVTTTAGEKSLPPLPSDFEPKTSSPIRIPAPAPTRGKKRKSSAIQIASDKDSEQASSDTLPVAKKTRGKAATTAPAPARSNSRAVSRTKQNNSVLSPRSHNSRTLPRSPLKEPQYSPLKPSPTKSFIARPISPPKPASPFKTAASAASAISAAAHGVFEQAKRTAVTGAGKISRTASREKTATVASTRGKMLPPPRPMASPQRAASQTSITTLSSEQSSTSSANTVITKPKRGGRVATATSTTSKITTSGNKLTKSNTAAKSSAMKATAAAKGTNKKVVVAEPAVGKRVLRSRKG